MTGEQDMEYTIRTIEEKDNRKIEKIIRDCLTEYGAAHEGTAWADPMLGRFSEVYAKDGDCYWVAEAPDGHLLGGVGIGYMEGTDRICELQKMYCIREARGTGVGAGLLNTALEFAAERYRLCYLETLDNMVPAQKFYEKHGFARTDEVIGNTGHFNCQVKYIKTL